MKLRRKERYNRESKKRKIKGKIKKKETNDQEKAKRKRNRKAKTDRETDGKEGNNPENVNYTLKAKNAKELEYDQRKEI